MKRRLALSLAVVAAFAVPVFAMMVDSGLKVGEAVTPFHPKHIAGPDKGTETCPPCKYGNRPAVQVWFHDEAEENAAGILAALNKAVENNKSKEFKAFGIFIAECEKCVAKTETIVKGLKFDNVGVATLDHSSEAIQAYKINTEADVKNTVLVYKDKKVVAKLVNVKADKEGLAKLEQAISKAL